MFELFLLSSLLPAVFVYLWTLITGDIRVGDNFESAVTLNKIFIFTNICNLFICPEF